MTGAFESSTPFAFFDYFRVPYRVEPSRAGVGDRIELPGGVGELWPATTGRPRLLWSLRGPAGRTVRFDLDGIPLAGHVLDDPTVRRALGSGWEPAEPVRDDQGERIASVWRHAGDGSVLLPFDPGDVMATLWSEGYRQAGRSGLRSAVGWLARRAYYLLRPAMPRAAQLRLRRAFTRVQGRARFPRWPVEDGLADLYDWLFELIGDLAGEPVPWLDTWPDGRSWALVLTHDVETSAGVEQRELLRAPERDLGLRSSWNLVAERYHVADAIVRELRDEGCEIGVHGLRHDGHDLGSRRLLNRRLPAMRAAAARWGAVGFRSPATQRRWEWMPGMGFDYDSSWTDTDPYEPQPGGCCTTLPFRNGSLVELPITLPQDHTVFTLLRRTDGRLWLDKAGHIRERGGMALVLTHPDYATDPLLAGAYRDLLAAFHADPDVWHALPRDVAGWWRDRAASCVTATADGWEVTGPAAGRGRVRLGRPGATARGRTARTLDAAEPA